MPTPEVLPVIQELITRYAKALNEADVLSLPAFFAADGLLMPDTYKTLPGKNLARNGSAWLSKNGFHIGYQIQQVSMRNGYAFVDAAAITTITDRVTNKEVVKTSRDFFVLHKEQEDWKIFRYIFNSAKEG